MIGYLIRPSRRTATPEGDHMLKSIHPPPREACASGNILATKIRWVLLFLSLELLLGIYRKSGIMELGGEERAKGMVIEQMILGCRMRDEEKVTWVEESGCSGMKTSLVEGQGHGNSWKIEEETLKRSGKVSERQARIGSIERFRVSLHLWNPKVTRILKLKGIHFNWKKQ